MGWIECHQLTFNIQLPKAILSEWLICRWKEKQDDKEYTFALPDEQVALVYWKEFWQEGLVRLTRSRILSESAGEAIAFDDKQRAEKYLLCCAGLSLYEAELMVLCAVTRMMNIL